MSTPKRDLHGEVKVFAPDSINGLLFGKQALIGHDRHLPARNRSSHPDRVDFSKFPFPPELEPAFSTTAVMKAEADRRSDVIPRGPPPIYTRLRHDQDQLESVVSYLDIYAKNSTRKTLLVHQEMEEHYIHPFSRRLARNVNGAGYQRFVAEKNRAVSAFQTATTSEDSFNRELPEIPNLTVSISGLKDPIQKYKSHAALEQQLAKTIAESQGVEPVRQKPPERDTMDLKKWRTLAENRFYGDDVNLPMKGKRVCPGKYNSRVGAVLDAFAPPEMFVPRASRAPAACRVDHLATWS